MREEVRVLALHRLTRAREAFAEGAQLLGTNALTGATNRFYYAAFHAARALLATREAYSSRLSAREDQWGRGIGGPPFVTLQTGGQPGDRFFDRGRIIVTSYDQVLSGQECGAREREKILARLGQDL